jgi:thioredoxin-like negative regulator of GroEL
MKSKPSIISCLVLLGLSVTTLLSGATVQKQKKPSTKSESSVFSTKSFKEILDSYIFIADFSQKPGERPISKEVFWKYPLKLSPVLFDIDVDGVDLQSMVFQVKGSGSRTEILNVGRVAFLDSEYIKAHEAWLAGREEFKDDVKSNRIFDFFLAVNALSAYKARLKLVAGQMEDPDLVGLSKRAAYFLASTYLQKKDNLDERIDRYAPWGLYNLAVIYHRFGRLRSTYGAAQEGLATLLKQGRSDYRSMFRQLLAEAFIKNRDLMSAIQELDTGIRQDPDPLQAMRMFTRAGDIYYDLNNYELAEDFYAISSAIDRERQVFSPNESILRGEIVFWLGRFDEAEKFLKSAVEYSLRSGAMMGQKADANLPWASLRIADTLLARAALEQKNDKHKFMDRARLAYFRVGKDFPRTEAAQIAAVRGACLDLPTYKGNNVRHARSMLEQAKTKNELPLPLMELVWACDAASYADRDKNNQMIAKVQEFAEKYPRSRFLDSMLPAVKEVQAGKINDYFVKQQWESATEFFEQKRAILFKKIPNDVAANLWTAYVATGRTTKAIPFWGVKPRKIDSDVEALRQAAFLFEASSSKNTKSFARERNKLNSQLEKRKWSKKSKAEEVNYLKRVLATKVAAYAYSWTLNIQDSWFELNEKTVCESLFPLLSRVSEDKKSSPQAREKVRLKVMNMPEDIMEKIKTSDASCFQSWLDFESKVLASSELQKKYSQRENWELAGPWLESVWALSESLNDIDKTADAMVLWRQIAEKAPADSFESKMARARLDPKKTEFESLWKK